MRIAGQPYAHLLFHFVLSHSGWRYAEVAAGRDLPGPAAGIAGALWTLGGVPQVVRSDNTAAVTHEMRRSGGRELNQSYADLLAHYGLESTRSNPGMAHENGVAEQAHYRLKDALNQALLLRGSRDFDTTEAYAQFVGQVGGPTQRLVQGKLERERPYLRPLPPAPVPQYHSYRARVRKWSTVQAAGHTYSVPSRLIGQGGAAAGIRDQVEVYYQDQLVERMERVRGDGEAR